LKRPVSCSNAAGNLPADLKNSCIRRLIHGAGPAGLSARQSSCQDAEPQVVVSSLSADDYDARALYRGISTVPAGELLEEPGIQGKPRLDGWFGRIPGQGSWPKLRAKPRLAGFLLVCPPFGLPLAHCENHLTGGWEFARFWSRCTPFRNWPQGGKPKIWDYPFSRVVRTQFILTKIPGGNKGFTKINQGSRAKRILGISSLGQPQKVWCNSLFTPFGGQFLCCPNPRGSFSSGNAF